MNLTTLAEQLEMDEGEVGEILWLFVETTTSALRMLQSAIVKEESEKAAAAAHSIKGAAANLQLKDIHEAATGLERAIGDNHMEDTLDAIDLIVDQLGQLMKILERSALLDESEPEPGQT